MRCSFYAVNLSMQRSLRVTGPELAVWFFSAWSLMKELLLHEKHTREREREREAPPWLCWRSVQKREMGVGWNRLTVWKVIKPGD